MMNIVKRLLGKDQNKEYSITNEDGILKAKGKTAGKEKEIYEKLLLDNKYIILDSKNNSLIVSMPSHYFFKKQHPSMLKEGKINGFDLIVLDGNNKFLTIPIENDVNKTLDLFLSFGGNKYWV